MTFLSKMSEKIKTQENERERPTIWKKVKLNEHGTLNILPEIIVQMQNGSQNSKFRRVHFPKGQDP